VLTAVLLDSPAPKARTAFRRKGRVRMDLAIVIVAVLIELDGDTCSRARVAVGSVAPVPLRITDIEELLTGARLDDATIASARELAAARISPITDLRSTVDYRRHLTGVLVERILGKLAKERRA